MSRNNNVKGVEFSNNVVKAGHRVYFVDAKADSRGNRYISLSECKSSSRDGAGGRERQRIHIYEEDFGKILDALGQAMRAIGYDLELGVVQTTPSVELAEDSSWQELDIPSLGDVLEEKL